MQHTAQEEMDTLALHGMVLTGCIVVEVLPTYFPVLPPGVTVSE
jgi:hypothetical protein